MTTSKVAEVVVYRARNLVNGHCYIGVTQRGIRQRERQHRNRANRGEGWRLHAAMRKYGHENIVFEMLGDFADDLELALVYEEEAIAAYKPEYNMSIGGEGMRGPLSPESLASFRAKRAGVPSYRKGIPLSEEHKARISAANKGQVPWSKGKKMPREAVEKMRQANLGNTHNVGRKHSEETKQKMREAAAKRPASHYQRKPKE